jgi:hypothetical protein
VPSKGDREVCYSPEADLVAGLVVGVVGVDALYHADDRRKKALAALPLLLAAHQLVEVVAWWGLEGQVSQRAGDLGVFVYLLIALGVVPIVVPYAVMRSEPDPGRRRWMLPFVVLGLSVATVLLIGMVTNTPMAVIGGNYIAYETVTPGGGLTVALYGLAVCVPFLMSSQRRLVIFGLANVAALIVLSALISNGLISLWCVWAAASSMVIALHIREISATRSTEPSPAALAG